MEVPGSSPNRDKIYLLKKRKRTLKKWLGYGAGRFLHCSVFSAEAGIYLLGFYVLFFLSILKWLGFWFFILFFQMVLRHCPV